MSVRTSTEPFSVGYHLRCSFDYARSEYKCYRQKDEGSQGSTEWLVKSLQALAKELDEIYKNPEPMNDSQLWRERSSRKRESATSAESHSQLRIGRSRIIATSREGMCTQLYMYKIIIIVYFLPHNV